MKKKRNAKATEQSTSYSLPFEAIKLPRSYSSALYFEEFYLEGGYNLSLDISDPNSLGFKTP